MSVRQYNYKDFKSIILRGVEVYSLKNASTPLSMTARNLRISNAINADNHIKLF